jgi:hypothetical protein
MGVDPNGVVSALGGGARRKLLASIITRTSFGPAPAATELSALRRRHDQCHDARVLSRCAQDARLERIVGRRQRDDADHRRGVSGSSSVLLFGRQGTGNLLLWRGHNVQRSGKRGRQGDHAYPLYYVWAYDAHDLAAVKAGANSRGT